jgi:putative oxygen-independent coproporphyrinogen III oxidase
MPLTPPPLSLYVHLPWCVRKCPYCDFNSHPVPELIPQAQYIDALLGDLDVDLYAAQARPLQSIFFGGGTPSLFSPEQIERLLQGVRARLALDPHAEITLEANPGTVEHGRFAGYRQAGVNRISLGAQTFDDQHLRLLGRIHAADDIRRCIDELARADIVNFNLDLMYGLPEQTPQQALADIETALALGPAHISHYQLTLEPGTVFYHRPPPLPDADLIWQMQLDCQERLAAEGYEQYEVSAYAKPRRRSTHNLNYWQFGDYIGVGAGAHGKLTVPGENDGTMSVVRTQRVRQPREYLLSAAPERVSERRRVSPRELPFEYMLNALRLLDGFDEPSFQARTGLELAAVSAAVDLAQQRGLLERHSPGCWRATASGQRFLNDLQALFLPD